MNKIEELTKERDCLRDALRRKKQEWLTAVDEHNRFMYDRPPPPTLAPIDKAKLEKDQIGNQLVAKQAELETAIKDRQLLTCDLSELDIYEKADALNVRLATCEAELESERKKATELENRLRQLLNAILNKDD